MDLGVLKDLIMVPGVSGFEEPIRNYLLEKLKDYSPWVDKLGNIHVKFGESSEKIAFVAHMDEIGFVTTHIEDDGYVRFAPIGGIDDRLLPGRIVEIFTERGIIYGVIGLMPPHLSTAEERKKIPTWKDMWIDVGSKSRDETIAMGIREMLPVRWKKDFVVIGNHIVTRGLDDRVGCAILYHLAERLANMDLAKEVHLIWTVQEETGLRGASAIGSQYQFDEIYVVDTMTSGNMPGVPFHLSTAKIGGGPAIRLVDRKGVAPLMLRNKIKEIARKKGIPLQESITGGTTDAATFFEHGIPSIAICVPVKYTHSPVEMMNINDADLVVELFVSIAEMR